VRDTTHGVRRLCKVVTPAPAHPAYTWVQRL